MRLILVPALAVLAIPRTACSSSSAPAPVAPAPVPAASSPAAPDSAPDSSVDERRKALDALLAAQWEWVMRVAPEFASMLGDRRYNDKWSDLSPAAFAARNEEEKAFLVRFEAIDMTGFPEQEALNRELMIRNLRQRIEGARFEDWLMPLHQMSGPHLELPQLVPLLPFATVKDYDDYIARLRSVPAVFGQVEELLRVGLAKRLVPPRFLLERAVGQVDNLARMKPEASPFATPVQKFPDTVPAAEQKRLRAEVLAAVREQVAPAYAGLAVFLRGEYVPHARTGVGVWTLPDGEARYAYAAKVQTTTSMSPDEIHQIGLREVERIEGEQVAIGAKLGFADTAAFRRHIRTHRKLYARSRREILDHYQKYTDRMYAALPRLFGRLPKQKMIILAVEEFREKAFAAAQYTQGALDGSRPAIVRVNTGDAKRRLLLSSESTAYHEGVPGHHLQNAIQQELPELPPFRQQGDYAAFSEGWALYSEGLGKEVGFYEDPYMDYGRLQDEMLRAIRLVVDTGLHYKKWTRDQVVQFFRDYSTIDEPNVQNETDRYIVWPGQALAYKIGQLTISRLRRRAEAELGGAFDVRAFHDEVLGAGTLPLDVLEARVAAWIARVKRAPAKAP